MLKVKTNIELFKHHLKTCAIVICIIICITVSHIYIAMRWKFVPYTSVVKTWHQKMCTCQYRVVGTHGLRSQFAFMVRQTRPIVDKKGLWNGCKVASTLWMWKIESITWYSLSGHSLIVALIKSPWWKRLCYLCLYKNKLSNCTM